MNQRALDMILKLREWDEEQQRQKLMLVIAERDKVESYLKQLEERFELLGIKTLETDSAELVNLFDQIDYLKSQINEVKHTLEKLNQELNRQRQLYEEAHIERRKIEQLLSRIRIRDRKEREKAEERLIAELFTLRFGSST